MYLVFFWVLLCFTWFYLVLLSFTGFYWVLLGFTGFYWVLLGVIGASGSWHGARVYFFVRFFFVAQPNGSSSLVSSLVVFIFGLSPKKANGNRSQRIPNGRVVEENGSPYSIGSLIQKEH